MQQWQESDTQPEVKVNENFDSLAGASVYGLRQPATTGLTWAYWGGWFNGATRSQGTLSLTNNATNYIVVAKASHTVSAATTTTNWDNLADYWRIGIATTVSGAITAYVDARLSPGGVFVSGDGVQRAVPLVNYTDNSAAENAARSHAGRMVRFTGTGAKTYTVASGTAFAAGEVVSVTNQAASGNVTLTESGVTLSPPKGGTLILEPGDTVSIHFTSSSAAMVYGSTLAA